jgi:trimeric autotransporter adhesin
MKQNYTKLPAAIAIGLFIATGAHAQIITTIAGSGSTPGFYGDGGQATNALLDDPDGVVVDDSGNVYITDQYNQRIRKITATTGVINTIAGHTLAGFAGDGELDTAAKFDDPAGLALDDSGNLYIADVTNNRIRKITKATGIITTIAGDDSTGYHKYDDGRPADSASLFGPSGVAVDDSGNVYIADFGNSLIRKVNAQTHNISTIAGVAYSPGYSGDNGLATAAKLSNPAGVALDDSGNIYISDNTNNRIRKITKATGIITTIAGNGKLGFSGDDSIADSAEIDYPFGLVVDGSGNVYFADEGNNRIREINKSTGIITTFAGGGTNGLGDGGPPDSAGLSEPIAVAFDGSGNLYIADQDHSRIREVIAHTTGINTVQVNTGITVYPVPSSGQMTVKLTGNGYIAMKVFDELGRVVYNQPLNVEQEENNLNINISNMPNGIYILQLLTQKGISCREIEVQK